MTKNKVMNLDPPTWEVDGIMAGRPNDKFAMVVTLAPVREVMNYLKQSTRPAGTGRGPLMPGKESLSETAATRPAGRRRAGSDQEDRPAFDIR